ncbi:M50 family metallopeptidase [Nocardioides sp. Soil805]|uniref:M50 family metallopeptidase n=1 Tax=Nocardioides sp. Soil805 TaxID=1736416 RepID=UPI0007034BB4|nr:site-2 protease family protein [Nocardioides sp. Soil805]KRF36386.1 zinc metalloprotease [Nocardioides sp. Soil805]
MTALYYTLGVLIFVFAILASIGLHEFGHLIPAKKFGGKVTQWFVGFGPTVFSRRVGETEYGVKAIPLGGYVKIVGMLPPGKGEETVVDEHGETRVRQSNTGMFTQLISDARAAEWEHVKPEDTDRLFYKFRSWQKVVVMAGGPMVNIAIAFFLFWGVFATVGQVVDAKVEPVVAEVIPCIVPASEDGRACTAEELRDNPSPAAAAGLEPGDRFVSFNGTPVTDWEQVQQAIRDNGDGTATMVVERDGERVELEATTQVQPRPLDSASPEDLTPVGFLGVMPVATPVYETGGPVYTLQQMGHMTVDTVQALVHLPVKVWGVARAIVGLEERDPLGPVSVVGGGRIAGEVASADESTFAMQDKVVSLVMLVAGFNLFIGLFNFIPLLPLDGGHIAGALWEAARRRFARLRGRPDPGYVDVARLLPIAYVVGAAMLVMGMVLIVGDLVVPLHLDA